jgi:hypothetical protein
MLSPGGANAGDDSPPPFVRDAPAEHFRQTLALFERQAIDHLDKVCKADCA